MCINIAYPKKYWLYNQGQRFAKNPIFVSHISSSPDEERRCCRLHFIRRHENRELPLDNFVNFLDIRYINLKKVDIEKLNIDSHDRSTEDDVKEVNDFINSLFTDSSTSRAFWKISPKITFKFNHSIFDLREGAHYLLTKDEQGLVRQTCSKGKWAVIINNYQQDDTPIPYILDEQGYTNFSLGYWSNDAFGCYLGYGIPCGKPMKFIDHDLEYSHGHDFGEWQILVPEGTKYCVFVRCSDSRYHSNYTILALSWDLEKQLVQATPIIQSLFPAPHFFPAKDQNDWFNLKPMDFIIDDTLDDAIAFCEQL